MLSIKAKIISILSIAIIIITFFALWRTTSIKLSNTKQQLEEVSCQLDSVMKENARLIEYNKRRDTEIKQLEQSYQNKLSSIPADLCGDMMPSKELIEFFKKGEQ